MFCALGATGRPRCPRPTHFHGCVVFHPGSRSLGRLCPLAPGLGRCGARMSTSPPSVRWAGEGPRVAPGSDRLLRTCRTVLRLHMVPSRQPGTRARLGGPRAVPQLSGLTIAAGVESQLTAADLQFPSDRQCLACFHVFVDHSLGKASLRAVGPFLNRVTGLVMSVLRWVWIPGPVAHVAGRFSRLQGGSSLLRWCPFKPRFLILIKANLSGFSFLTCAFGNVSEDPLPSLRAGRYSPVFSLRVS